MITHPVTAPPAPPRAGFDVVRIRDQFPILQRTMRGQPLVYLDHASTTQKPKRVIDAEALFYATANANVHRGVYELSEQATAAYVGAHEAVTRFIGAGCIEEVVFVRNATEGINLVADGFAAGAQALRPREVILLTAMEHHSNIVPWQVLARRTGARLAWVELTPDGRLDLEDLDRKLAGGARIVSLTHVSNVLGTVNPVTAVARRAHAAGAVVVVDAAQSAARRPLDVRALGADFLVFSSHKMYGPTGIGVVFGKRELLAAREPFLTGGDMVKAVTREGSTWNDLPWKFEAGTPNVAGGIALGTAVQLLTEIGLASAWAHEQALAAYATTRLGAVPGLKLLGPVGPAADRAGIFSFTLPGIHSHDLASFLDERGIAIRGGHHCAQPLLRSLGLTDCARASVGLTTTTEEIDRLAAAVEEARRVLA